MEQPKPQIMTNFQPVNSSNIESVAYDGTNLLQVKFKSGGVYQYEGVFPQLYGWFAETFDKDPKEKSSTAFFNENIKSLKFTRIQ